MKSYLVVQRNVDARSADDVASWPYETLVTAIDRGLVPGLAPDLRGDPKRALGATACRAERSVGYREHDCVSTLFRLAIERAREGVERTGGSRGERGDRTADHGHDDP